MVRFKDGRHRVARALVESHPTIAAVQFEGEPAPAYRDCRSTYPSTTRRHPCHRTVRAALQYLAQGSSKAGVAGIVQRRVIRAA